jgi:transposase InsO family protein
MCYGPEFISKELNLWAFMHEVTLDFSWPGKPTDNAFIESFNGKFRGNVSTRTGSSAHHRLRRTDASSGARVARSIS